MIPDHMIMLYVDAGSEQMLDIVSHEFSSFLDTTVSQVVDILLTSSRVGSPYYLAFLIFRSSSLTIPTEVV